MVGNEEVGRSGARSGSGVVAIECMGSVVTCWAAVSMVEWLPVGGRGTSGYICE